MTKTLQLLMFSILTIVALATAPTASSTPTLASGRQDCEAMALDAAKLISKLNKNARSQIEVTTLTNDENEQIVNVTFDTANGGAHVGYTVTVQRNASPIEANQTCMRVTKLELTSEE